jgi:ankyrin repeat protein
MTIRLPARSGGSYDLAALRCAPHLDPTVAVEALEVFCDRNDIEAVMWLADRFGRELSTDDARFRAEAMLRDACRDGAVGIAQWLVNWFGMTAADARDAGALLVACREGRYGIVSWLFSDDIDGDGRPGLTVDDAHDDDDAALRAACWEGNSDVAQLLLEPPPLGVGATPPQALAREIFLEAIRHGEHSTAQVLFDLANIDNSWLAEQAGLPRDEGPPGPAWRPWPAQLARLALRLP